MSADMRRTLRVIASLAALTGVTGCLDPVDPGDAAVDKVQVTFDGTNTADTIQVRETTRANAAAVAKQGYDLGRTDFTFSSSNDAVAVVEPTGVVRAVAPGEAVIRATLRGGLVGEGRVVVVPSTVAYSIPVGTAPGGMAFSPDYTRLYVVIAPDSLAIVDALGYFRLSAVPLGLAGNAVAATGEAVYVTHPQSDSVSVIPTSTGSATRRIFVGRSPQGAAATPERAFIAVGGDRRIAVLAADATVGTIALAGAPRQLAVARDGRRLFATAYQDGAWRLVIAAPATTDTIHSVALSSEPMAIATDLSGSRVYVLLPTEARVAVFVEDAGGRYAAAGSVPVGAGATGVSSRLVGEPLVVASGQPVTIFNGATLATSEQVAGVGSGGVAVRPDGVFAFIADVAAGVLRVIGL